MTLAGGSIPIRPADLTPVTQWLGELRGRVTDWSRDVKNLTQEEWNRLQGSVKGALSTRRVEQVLKDFLQRIGVAAHSEVAEDLAVDLRTRILSYRSGTTIEAYPHYLTEPPKIRL